MAPPFGPFANGPGGRPRGPPPFVVQMLRAPLTLNNLVALAITYSVYKSRSVSLEAADKPCALRVNNVFGLLAILFTISIGHNFLTVMRFHRIRREVFGESMCAARRRWRSQRCGEVTMSEEEMQARKQKFHEMGKKMPSLVISIGDMLLSVAFLGFWVLTTLMAKREGKVELGVAYSSIGALVACVINLIVGVNGLKFWARSHKKENQAGMEEARDVDVKEKLLEN